MGSGVFFVNWFSKTPRRIFSQLWACRKGANFAPREKTWTSPSRRENDPHFCQNQRKTGASDRRPFAAEKMLARVPSPFRPAARDA